MNVTINNKPTELEAGATLRSIAESNRLPDKGVAIAVNNNMVPREQWDSHSLAEGDSIIILKAFCGG